jgi:hypothetical protein
MSRRIASAERQSRAQVLQWRAEERILDIVVIAGHHSQLIRHGVSRTGPHDLKYLVAETVHTKGSIVNIRVVVRLAALANEASPDIRKGGLRIAGRSKSNVFVTGI